MSDPAMRRNRIAEPPAPALIAPPVTFTFDHLPAAMVDSPTMDYLSPAEQREQAILISQTFREYYMAKLLYLDNSQIAVAIIRPREDDRQSEGPLQIIVDNQGNVRVLPQQQRPTSTRHPAFGRILFAGSLLTAVASSLLIVLT